MFNTLSLNSLEHESLPKWLLLSYLHKHAYVRHKRIMEILVYANCPGHYNACQTG